MAVVPSSSRATASSSSSDSWVDDSATAWTYASASTFTTAGDRTGVFVKGTRLRFTQTTVKYGTVVSSSHAAGTTTVTIAVNTDYVLANAAISVNSYSYADAPPGYPFWFAWTPSPQGFTGAVTVTFAQFSIVGRTCTIMFQWTGSSNATTHTFTLPVAAARTNALIAPAFGRDNSAALISPACLNNAAADNQCQAYKSYALNAWTAMGNKDLIGCASYEI